MRSALMADERGSVSLEYLIALGLIGIGMMAAVRFYGDSISTKTMCFARVLDSGGACRAPGTASLAPLAPPPARDEQAATPAPLPGPPPASAPAAAVPAPSPGPSPVPPPSAVPGPILPPTSPPIRALPLGTAEGGGALLDNAAAKRYLIEKVAARTRRLLAAGRDRNTAEYGPQHALDTVAAITGDIDRAGATYGIDRALLAGVIASEIDFDTDFKDIVQNEAAEHGFYRGQGQGLANVHLDTLQEAQRYLQEHRLPGAEAAARFEATPANVYANPAEAAAIVLAHRTDLKRRAGGSTSSAEDMAVIFGAYRNGEENFDLAANRNTNGGEELAEKVGDPRAAMGTDAYQSEAYFQYYVEYYEAVDQATGSGGGRTEI